MLYITFFSIYKVGLFFCFFVPIAVLPHKYGENLEHSIVSILFLLFHLLSLPPVLNHNGDLKMGRGMFKKMLLYDL